MISKMWWLWPVNTIDVEITSQSKSNFLFATWFSRRLVATWFSRHIMFYIFQLRSPRTQNKIFSSISLFHSLNSFTLSFYTFFYLHATSGFLFFSLFQLNKVKNYIFILLFFIWFSVMNFILLLIFILFFIFNLGY